MNKEKQELSDVDFAKLSKFIQVHFGIKMPYIKKNMLQTRLKKRLTAHNMTSYKAYCQYIFNDKNRRAEIVHMIDVVSTNKTAFFREPTHFDFMREVALPAFAEAKAAKTLKVWSSACSSGEEIYTIAMVINEFLKNTALFDFSILGTDISTKMLKKAVAGIYQESRIESIPLFLKKKYLLRNKDATKKDVMVVPKLKRKTRYQRVNLMDKEYRVSLNFDLIFCRNVLIYFDKITQEKVIRNLCTHLRTGGYLFLGHSESIMGMRLPLRQIKPTIHQKIDF